jgi:hypothetical protein
LLEACHIPPAFSQSAWLVIVESDFPLVDGLADGAADDPVEPDELDPEEPDDPPVDGADIVPEPELLPGLLELLPDPLLDPPAAAAIAGTRHMTPIRTRESILFI